MPRQPELVHRHATQSLCYHQSDVLQEKRKEVRWLLQANRGQYIPRSKAAFATAFPPDSVVTVVNVAGITAFKNAATLVSEGSKVKEFILEDVKGGGSLSDT